MSRAFGYTAFGDSGTQEFFERPDAVPGPSEIAIRVRAVGVNPIDWKIRNGWMANPEQTQQFPQAFGVEAAGVVAALGQDVEGFAVGDEVFGTTAAGAGAYAETTLLDGGETAPKPAQLSFVQAAALAVAAATAFDALAHVDVAEGGTLLVNGVGGGVGLVAAQIARDRGITVFGTASEDKRALVEGSGATLITYAGGDVVARMRQILPGGVDAVIDLVGGESLRQVAVLVTDPARIVSAADPTVSALGGAMVRRSHDRATLEQVAALVAGGKVDLHVTETYSLDQAAQALSAVESGHVLGKIVIDLTQSTEV